MGAQGFEEVAVAGAGFEEEAGGLEVLHEPAGERRGRLDIIVADVVAVRLGAHDARRVHAHGGRLRAARTVRR